MKGKKKKPSYVLLERRMRGMEAEALATSDRRLALIDCLFSVVKRATKLLDEKRALEALLEEWRQAEKDRLDRNAWRMLQAQAKDVRIYCWPKHWEFIDPKITKT